MRNIKIETGIPIPNRHGLNKGGLPFVMSKMKIGDSITINSNYGNIHNAAKKAQIKITVRMLEGVKKDETNASKWMLPLYQIWRIHP